MHETVVEIPLIDWGLGLWTEQSEPIKTFWSTPHCLPKDGARDLL